MTDVKFDEPDEIAPEDKDKLVQVCLDRIHEFQQKQNKFNQEVIRRFEILFGAQT